MLRSLEPGNPSNSSGGGRQSTADARKPSVIVLKHEGLGGSVCDHMKRWQDWMISDILMDYMTSMYMACYHGT